VALIAWGLKRHYADASTDALSWILMPTAHLVALVTGVAFAAVPGEGYFSAERMFLIEKACAGVNFLVAAFGDGRLRPPAPGPIRRRRSTSGCG
jgi:exosortase K